LTVQSNYKYTIINTFLICIQLKQPRYELKFFKNFTRRSTSLGLQKKTHKGNTPTWIRDDNVDVQTRFQIRAHI